MLQVCQYWDQEKTGMEEPGVHPLFYPIENILFE